MHENTAAPERRATGAPSCDRCGDTAFSVTPGEPCGRNLAGDPLGGDVVAQLELDAVDTAAAWVAAIDDFEAYIHSTSTIGGSPLPVRDEDVTDEKRSRKYRLFHELQEVLPILPGDTVEDHHDRGKGTPWGPVLRVSEKSVTIANHHNGGGEHRIEMRHVARQWTGLEERARAIVAAGMCGGTYR